MEIAVLSGKGGTGKTTLATNLAFVQKKCILIDTDVEEPNSHIFLKPKELNRKIITTEYPNVDKSKCVLCGDCGDFCRYNAILPAKNKVLVFKEMCHDCGGCKLVCKHDAIHYEKQEIGSMYFGETAYGFNIKYGDLKVGAVSGVKIIETLKSSLVKEDLIFIDSPPGTSCSTVAAVKDADYAVIVSEPTPFGVSDMKMVVEMLRNMNILFGVVINKAGLGDNEIYEYCEEENIRILGEIPFEKRFARAYANGEILSNVFDEYRNYMQNILNKISN